MELQPPGALRDVNRADISRSAGRFEALQETVQQRRQRGSLPNARGVKLCDLAMGVRRDTGEEVKFN